MHRPAPLSPRFSPRCRAPRQRGATLIEILVAVLIVSLGLLGLAGMQLRALRASVSSVQRTQAVILSQYLLDLMRVDRASAMAGGYNTAGGLDTPVCTVPAAAAGNFSTTELRMWLSNVKTQIGQLTDTTTCAAIACDVQGVCTVQLRWDDSLSGGLPNQTLSIATRL